MSMPRSTTSFAAAAMAGLALTALVLVPVRDEPSPAPRFDQPDAADALAQSRRRPASGRLDTVQAYERASRQAAAMSRFSTRIDRDVPREGSARVWLANGRVTALGGSSTTAVLDAWTPLGPGNIGGRTRVVRYHPTRPSTLFAGGVSGGLWRSDDAGASWGPLGDGLTNIAVNALAIDPRQPDTMWVGTGEGYFREEIRGTGLPLRGAGIFISRDGGGRWQRLAATATSDFHWVNDLELGVGDARRLYAATRTGVWRSLDGGETWRRIVEVSVRGGCLDLAMRPDRTDDTLFASCGSYDQATVYRIDRASSAADVQVVLREPYQGRTSLAIAPSAPDTIYALAASNDGGPDGNYRQGLLAVYRSERGGAAGTWEARVRNTDAIKLHTLLLTNTAAATVEECGSTTVRNTYTTMGWYINVIAVDPRDRDRVWAAGVDWFRSDDGGRTWGMASQGAQGRPSYAHVDQHGIAFHPTYDGQGNQEVLIGNDGGVFRSTNARAGVGTGPRVACTQNAIAVAWESLNRGYGVTQFYHGTPFGDGSRYLAGAQDNGTILGSDEAGPEGWRTILGGDGSVSAVDPQNPNVFYAQFQWASLFKSVDGGRAFVRRTTGLDAAITDILGPDANYLFVTPLAMDPRDGQRLWLGGEFLYRSQAAEGWTKVGEAMPNGGVASAVAVSPHSGQVVAVGTHRGDVVVVSDGGAPGTAASSHAARPRDGWVTSVAFDPSSPQVLYATYGNFGGAHVYRSDDRGLTWIARDGAGDGALPDIPVHALVVDPDDSNRLYAGTDLGVFVSTTGGDRWMVEETGFGPTVTEWLSLLRTPSGQKRLFAFTHGRGAWRVDVP